MPQLRHRKATLDHIIFSVPKPLVMMALCAKELDGTTPVNTQSNESKNPFFDNPTIISTTNPFKNPHNQ